MPAVARTPDTKSNPVAPAAAWAAPTATRASLPSQMPRYLAHALPALSLSRVPSSESKRDRQPAISVFVHTSRFASKIPAASVGITPSAASAEPQTSATAQNIFAKPASGGSIPQGSPSNRSSGEDLVIHHTAAGPTAAPSGAVARIQSSPAAASPLDSHSVPSGAGVSPVPGSMDDRPSEQRNGNKTPDGISIPAVDASPIASGQQTTNEGAGATSMGLITAAPYSALKTQAVAQATVINTDWLRSKAQVLGIAETRRRQTRGHFSGVREGLSSFFIDKLVGVQTLIGDKQAEIIGASTRALAWVRTAIKGTLQAAQALGIQTRARINQALEDVTTAVQNRVEGIASQITGLIDSVPLPDIPGIGQIRGTAVRLLNRAAGVVNGALGRLIGFIRSAFNAGMNILDSLLSGIARVLDMALSVASSAILSVIRMIGQLLNHAVALIGSTLRRALLGVLVPMLDGIEALLIKMIGIAEQRALALLRSNRNQYLVGLAEGVTAGPASVAAQGTKATSAESGIAAIQQLGRDAIQNNRMSVQTFELLTSATLAPIIGILASAAARIVAGIAALLAQAVQAIVTTVMRAIQILAEVAQAIANFVRDLIQAFIATLGSLAEYMQSLVQSGVDQLIQFAKSGLSRITSFVTSFVRNLILGRGISASITDAIGEFSPSRGPITKPRPGPITIPDLYRIFIILAVIGAIILYAVPQLAVIVTALISLGLSPLAALAVLAIIAILVFLLVLLLLYLLYRWLTKPKLPPGKRVISVTPSVLELGVGGRDITSAASIAPGTPARPPLTWTINPGGTAPAGVSVIGSGQTVKVRAAQPPHGTVVGGTPISVRAALTANPADFADSARVMMVQVLNATYTAAPPLAPVPSLIPGTPPPNSAEPNRDGIAGNTALVNATTAPAARPITVAFRRSLGARVAGTTITPGSNTGDIGLRITDSATAARLDETQPATAGPAALMADLTVNAVPLRVRALAGGGPLGPYGVLNTINFASSDSKHPPLTRIVGELITNGGDDFNVPPPNFPPIGFNNSFDLRLAVPANSWNDQLVTSPTAPNATDGRPAIDVNRFVGPGVPQLPRRLIYRQRFQYSSWQGAGTIISKTIDDGQHIRSLIGSPVSFQFTTDHRFGGVAAPKHTEPYVGNPLIVLSNVVATPTAPGATALAADGVATANLGVTSSAAGGSVNWSILNGDIAITAGNPAVLPATATLRAGVRTGNFGVRAADTIFPNRRVDGRVGVVAVALRSMNATPNPVPAGTASVTVSLNADPGGRTVNWSVDAAAAAAGVTITPATTGPAAAPMSVTVTRPGGFTGTVTVTAVDSVVATRANRVRISFR